MFCNHCGSKLHAQDTFCSTCGSKFVTMLRNVTNPPQFSQKDTLMKSPGAPKNLQNVAKSELKEGIVWFVGGTGITLAGYFFAQEGSTYYIFWGAMIYGTYKLLKGIWHSINS